jgi:opacity protein-like surface antigen
MKKLFYPSLMALAMFAFTHSASAQFNKGDKQFNLGVGIGSLGANTSIEYGIMDDLGVGLFASYERPSTGLIGAIAGVRYSYNEISIGPRAAYHLGRVLNLNDDKFDVYVAGGVLGRFTSYNNDYWQAVGLTRTTSTSISLLARVGARMTLSDKMAGFAEIGSGGSWVQAGISFKF